MFLLESILCTDGRCLAVAFRVKFIEVSVGINHNVDELLVGLLHQIRLKQAQAGEFDETIKINNKVHSPIFYVCTFFLKNTRDTPTPPYKSKSMAYPVSVYHMYLYRIEVLPP